MNTQMAYNRVKELLLARRDQGSGAWSGQLSSSALSTALAVTALEEGDDAQRKLARRGAQWLVDTINDDGGWGDTSQSPSNISTSLITRASIARHPECMGINSALSASGAWILAETGGLDVGSVATKLKQVYGDDKTFAVPILMYLALCNNKDEQWRDVPSLPFCLALLPGWCFRFLKMEVVSYALPALIAVGLCRHIRCAQLSGKKPWGRLVARRLLVKLERIQPEDGGFLEAAPLTAFVVLALQHCGYGDCEVVRKGLRFLQSTVLDDGSWPIDTNLRCWLTALAVRALSDDLRKRPQDGLRTAEWLVNSQHCHLHPYTGAPPGGWAWTDLTGGVPDADDTSATLIALFYLREFVDNSVLNKAARSALIWLLDLQNSDGGIPTFCRGWGRLPFDRSCCDITAHALEAFVFWRTLEVERGRNVLDCDLRQRIDVALKRMLDYLEAQQHADGSWLPLWFGHQQSPDKTNPVIGTARVVAGLRTFCDAAHSFCGELLTNRVRMLLHRGESFLVCTQKSDGGWSAGDAATIEESALAVAALLGSDDIDAARAADEGRNWLSGRVLEGKLESAPLGLYFSALWYDEELYPLIWSLAALRPL
jgi:squalene-hopene/tetraprenyl-beta-curcumene cyclase